MKKKNLIFNEILISHAKMLFASELDQAKEIENFKFELEILFNDLQKQIGKVNKSMKVYQFVESVDKIDKQYDKLCKMIKRFAKEIN